jgi:predicted KAP-like P-loop ATPase
VVLEIVKDLPQDADKIKFLSALAPRLSMGLLPNALRLIQDAFTQDADRAEALSNLVPYLPIEQLPEAFRLITQSIKTPRHQTTAIENLIPFLSFQGFQDVLNLIEEHGITQSEDKPTTESETKAITEPKLQARILRKAATALGVGQVGAGLSQPPPSIESEGFLTPQAQEQVESSLLIDKIIHLTEQLKPCQRNDFSYEKEAADILSQLAPALAYLPNVLQNKVSEHVLQFLQSVQQFKDLGYSAQLLSAFTPYFPEAANPFLANCSGDDYRALLNIRIRAAIPGKLDTQVLNETFKTIEGQYRKAEALVEIACHPAGSNYQTETLQTIRRLSNTYRKAQYLQRLTPHLLDNQRLETANIIREITNPYHKVKALVALACKFPEFRTEVRTAAQALGNRVQRIEQLSTLAVEVPEILPDILDLAEKVDQLIERKEILLALAPHLPMRINREVNRERPVGRPSIEDQDLWNRSLYLLARGYRDALQGGSLRNETAQDKDFLNLQDEINALSDLLLMRDLEPPMTVGILGGWGGGKSYIMHLMQTHVTEVRSRPVAEAEAWNPDPKNEKLSPYVGHIYQIKFDAWTFAKSDLWASLMQTIFFELDRQLTLETQITTILNGILDLGKRRDLESKIWAVLYKTSDTERQWFLERVLTDKVLLNQLSGHNQGETTGQLWKTLHNTQQEAIEQLKKTQQQLEVARRELDTKKATIRTQINDQFAPLLKINDLKQKQSFKRVDALLGTSFILLRQRIGPRLFKHFHNEIHQELYGEESNSSKSGKRVGLWQELSQTLEQLEQARKELALAAAELQPSQLLIGNSTTSPSNVALLSNTESSAETSVEQSRDEAAEQPKPTQEEVQQKVDALFQKAEGLKLDIQTVAASVIEQQYWKVNWVSGWQWVRKNWLVLLLLLGFFISPLLLWKFFQINPIEIGTATVEQILTRIAAILAPTLPALVTLQSLLRSSHKWFEETQLALHEYEKSVENRNKQLEDTIETTIQKRLQEDSELQELERNVRQLQTQVEQQQQALPVNEYASLNDFVNDRLSSKTYANRLGLMQQVKEDLFDLSNKLLPPSGQSLESKINFLQGTFPRGPARVVIYIDDLDRCPPDRVVQVLEAVQLLVKTPLFIAVLAVDERYITRALEKFYEGVLSRRGRPSGTDYLEKIIQLPYRVRPIMANTLESYLRSQVVIQDSATGGAKFSEFSRQEFNMLLACCQQVDLSPRTLKRLTNVYKLFKIVCRTRGTKPSPQAQQAILALLALSGRYSSLMRGIFDSIETCFEEQRTAEKAEKTLQTLHLRSPLRDFFHHYQLPEGDRYLQRELEKLTHDALQTAILPPALTLEDMTHEIFNLIRSFSFVGEIGENPEDHHIIGSTVGDLSLRAMPVPSSESV